MANEYDTSSVRVSEEMRAFQLAQARNQAPETDVASVDDTAENVETTAEQKTRVGVFEGGIMLILGASNDILDYFILGSIPVLGDLIDGFTWSVIAFWAMLRGLKRPRGALFAGALEFIPLGDLIPTYTAMVLWIIVHNNRPTA